MNDPNRLIVSPDTTDLEKDLLSSWGDERPSAASRQKTLAALGVAASITAAGSAGASVTPKAAAAGWTVLTKWLTASAIAVGATVAGIGLVMHLRSTPKEIAPAVVVTVTPARIAHTAPPVELVETPAPIATVEIAEPVHHAPQTQTTKAPPAPPEASTLTQQVAALDRARGALDSGDTARARKLVDSYESEYPGGAFTQEAEVVRIEALAHEGNRAEAERAGKRFLSAYPKSPHAARVRTLSGYAP